MIIIVARNTDRSINSCKILKPIHYISYKTNCKLRNIQGYSFFSFSIFRFYLFPHPFPSVTLFFRSFFLLSICLSCLILSISICLSIYLSLSIHLNLPFFSFSTSLPCSLPPLFSISTISSQHTHTNTHKHTHPHRYFWPSFLCFLGSYRRDKSTKP